jgi:hypothetical protein
MEPPDFRSGGNPWYNFIGERLRTDTRREGTQPCDTSQPQLVGYLFSSASSFCPRYSCRWFRIITGSTFRSGRCTPTTSLASSWVWQRLQLQSGQRFVARPKNDCASKPEVNPHIDKEIEPRSSQSTRRKFIFVFAMSFLSELGELCGANHLFYRYNGRFSP